MNGNKKEYDLIFSLGEACSCSEALRHSVLQVESYPLDWLFGSDYTGRCNLLANNFNRFINKEDLEQAYEERNINCIAYHNKYNDITFNHDFLKDLSFDNAYEIVSNKYKRRIERLLTSINNAKSFLIVYVEIPTKSHIEVENSTILNGYNIIKEQFGEKFDLLYIKNKENSLLSIEQIDNNITKITYDYKNYKSDLDYAVISKKLCKVLKNYKLNMPYTCYLKHILMQKFIKLVPVKSIRLKLRKKYHVY